MTKAISVNFKVSTWAKIFVRTILNMNLFRASGCEFQCNDFNSSCIPQSYVCNGKPDCPNGRDEEQQACCKCSMLITQVITFS